MRTAAAGVGWILLLGITAAGHRLDEYLQASLISLARDRVQVQLDLTPGVAVLPAVLAQMDPDRDGIITEAERGAYVQQVLRDISLSVDGERVQLKLLSTRFPEMAELKDGLGVIRLELGAALTASWPGARRRLVFENHHQSAIAAYLVNSLIPEDPALRIMAQSRDYRQSVYRVDYAQSGAMPWWVWAALLLLPARAMLVWRRRNALKHAAGVSHVNM